MLTPHILQKFQIKADSTSFGVLKSHRSFHLGVIFIASLFGLDVYGVYSIALIALN